MELHHSALGHGEDLLGGRIDFELDQTIAELHVGYRLVGPDFAATGRVAANFTPGGKELDAYLGARYWHTQSVEEMSGSGTERNGSKIVTTGPIIGLIYRF